MAWTYGCDPLNNPVDAVRFHLGDTNPNSPLLKDEEIQYLIECYSGTLAAAAAAADAVSAMFSRSVDESTGDVKRSCAQRARNFRMLADKLRQQADNPQGATPVPFAGGISIGEMNQNKDDCDRFPDLFQVGQLDSYKTEDGRRDSTFGERCNSHR